MIQRINLAHNSFLKICKSCHWVASQLGTGQERGGFIFLLNTPLHCLLFFFFYKHVIGIFKCQKHMKAFLKIWLSTL
jgi:hypothetical protein